MLNFLKKQNQYNIRILPQNLEIKISSQKTILQSLLDQGINFPHNCRVGSCTTCISKLKDGKVKELTDKAFVLTEEQMNENYILICQSIPRSDIVIEKTNFNQNNDFINAKITARKNLTHDILELTIELEKNIYFQAGQYVNFYFDWLDRPRSYSMANRPFSKGNSILKFFIRKVPGGKFTEWIFKQDHFDEVFQISGPEGNFYLRNIEKPIIFIAGGSGLSPIFSILEDVVYNQDKEINKKTIQKKVKLLFGVRTQKDLYKMEELQIFKKQWQNEFEIVPILSEETSSNWKGEIGFIHDFLKKIQRLENFQLYMCGPPVMIDKCTEIALQNHIKSENIFFDKFTDTRDILKSN